MGGWSGKLGIFSGESEIFGKLFRNFVQHFGVKQYIRTKHNTPKFLYEI